MQIMRWLTILAYLMAAVCILSVLLSGPLYKLGWWSFGSIFATLKITIPLGLFALVLLLIGRFSGAAGNVALLVVVVLGALLYLPVTQALQAKKLPYIHDISTDTSNPPEFSQAMRQARSEARNPAEYPGPETASQQATAYPDIQPITVAFPPAQVMARVKTYAASQDWQVVSSDAQTLEATDTTFWFGFKDDVVIRLQPQGTGTRVDIRSKSRVGQSDIGKNAARIRAFSKALNS